MLLTIDESGDFNQDGVFETIMHYFKKGLDKVRVSKDEFVKEFAYKFISKCLPKEDLLSIVQKFNNYISIVIC